MAVLSILPPLLAGLGLMLFGMRTLCRVLEAMAGPRLSRLLARLTRRRLVAAMTGAAVAAAVQSSTAATVMTVGLVDAGLLSLTQAVGVMIGANVGTCATAFLLSANADWSAVFALAGLALWLAPRRIARARQACEFCMALGVLLTGMDRMATAMAPLRAWAGLAPLLSALSGPFTGLVAGTGLAALLHSSAAGIGILQALAGEGLLGLRGAACLLYGQNIGTCVTALLSSAGASAGARRAAVVHLLFNCAGAALFTPLTCWTPFTAWITAVAPGQPRLQLALTHLCFNLVTAALLLPCDRALERAARALVREKKPRTAHAGGPEP